MRGLEFPIIGTKIPHLTKKFDLTSPSGREAYFKAKVGEEIRTIRRYLRGGNFMAFLIGKKNSGKGTYAKLFTEIFGEEKVIHLSVGDLVRDVHANWDSFSKSADFETLKKVYRGYLPFDEVVDALLGRSIAALLPTEFVLSLLKVKIASLRGRSIFIDGLPREADQVSYSLYFRDLAGYTDSQDMFMLIDIPEAVIDERIKYRVVCPKCQTSRNKKLLITSKLDYNEKTGEPHLICDNPDCDGAQKMVSKEGDDLGIAPIKGRLTKDEEILKTVFSLHGIPKILLRNHVPVTQAKKYFDDYELTPEYILAVDKKTKKVMVKEKPWTIKDDNGVECFSLLAPPVMVAMLKQMAEVLKS